MRGRRQRGWWLNAPVRRLARGLPLLLLLAAGCALPGRHRPAQREAGYPGRDTPLGRLHTHLDAILMRGRLPALDGVTSEEWAALRDRDTGVAAAFRDWLDYCIAYNRTLEAAQAYEPLPVVRRFQEDPLNMIWRGDAWARRVVAEPDPLLKALAVYREDMGVSLPPAAPAPDADDPLTTLRDALVEAAAIVDREALGALDAEQRELMRFVVPWLTRVNAPFVNRSQGAPTYSLSKLFRPPDPFTPGAATTPAGLAVPEALYSMTGVYHYLRALAGEPVRTDGIRADRREADAATHTHPDFEAAVDMAAMGRALQRLQPVLAPAALDRVEAALHALAAAPPPDDPITWPGVTGRLLLAEDTPYGALLIGGPDDNRYEDVEAAFILDLGGDNTYRFSGTPESIGRYPLQVIVDFAGDDVYIADGIGGPGAGILGISILIDRQGDDRYLQGLSPGFPARAHTRATILADDPEGVDTRWVPFATLYGDPEHPDAEGIMLDAGFAFGAAFMGIGILHDAEGDDLYLGQRYCFGSAFWKGLALLLDGGGDDVFAAGHTAIGSGINSAVGILESGGGDNHYQCLGLFESGYSAGTERDNGYDASGIGYGSGWRAEARRPDQGWTATLGGGLGAVIDAEGDDQYIGSSFGIASGYAGGIGLLVDGAGDDTYFAKRGPGGSNENGWSGNHAVANGAHRGVGYLLDRGGNDRYSASSIGGGNAWDISSAFLLDLGGDDQYTDLHGRNVRGSTGNGAANSFAVCFNAGGANTWQRNSLGSAHWLPEGYPGTDANFSFFISAGDEPDAYPRGYSNDTVRLNGVVFEEREQGGLKPRGFGLFADGPRALPER